MGSHILNGGTGDDTLSAGDGNDILIRNASGSGAVLNGGAGNHIITSDEGVLNGGTGADTIKPGLYTRIDYNSVSESPAGAGRDHIVGFIREEPVVDYENRIDLLDLDAITLVSGNQPPAHLGVGLWLLVRIF